MILMFMENWGPAASSEDYGTTLKDSSEGGEEKEHGADGERRSLLNLSYENRKANRRCQERKPCKP